MYICSMSPLRSKLLCLLLCRLLMLRKVVVKPRRIKPLTTSRNGCSGFTILTDNRPLSHMKFRVNVYLKEQDALELV